MLCLPGLGCKEYWERITSDSPVPELDCPSCHRPLRGHGWYPRYVGGQRVLIRRLRCAGCGVSHALLPEDLCAYQDLTLTSLEQARQRDGPTAAALAAGCEGAVRRARRWRDGRLWQELLALLPVAGDVWQRVVTRVGPEPGMLVRLRHWLWSHLAYLLGGPCGLFRHGRPGSLRRRAST
jgi:hypothetical protein